MAQTADVTFEEATHCPKCKEPGKETMKTPTGKGIVHTYTCMNERCTWFETGWVIQVLPDGSIPLREKGEKQFNAYTAGQESMARGILQQVALETGTKYDG